jgi:hypothetical protein
MPKSVFGAGALVGVRANVDEAEGRRHPFDMSITGVIENGMIKLPVSLPDGTKVEVLLPKKAEAESPARFEKWLTSSIGMAKGKLTTDERMRETRGAE